MSAAKKLALDAAVIDAIANAVVAKLRMAEDPAHYDQDNAPIPKSAYLRASRAGAFPSFKRGKRILARREDVDAWIESGPQRTTQPVQPANDVAPAQQKRAKSLAERTMGKRRHG